jgi:hypothetical protein
VVAVAAVVDTVLEQMTLVAVLHLQVVLMEVLQQREQVKAALVAAVVVETVVVSAV